MIDCAVFQDGCILFEAVGDERNFMLPMLRHIKATYNCRIVGLVRFKEDQQQYQRNDLFDAVYSTSEMINASPECYDEIIRQSKVIEEKFDSIFHYNLCDNRLFFTGCTSFPYTTIQTNQKYEIWLDQINKIYRGVEKIFQDHNVTAAINGRRVVTDVARARGLPIRALGYSFLHDRMIWRDGMKVRKDWLAAEHGRRRAEADTILASTLEPPPFHLTIRSGFFNSLKLHRIAIMTARILVRTLYWRIRKFDKIKKFGYSQKGHILLNFQRRRAFSYLKSKATSAREIIDSGRPYVFMALQMEPEVLLSSQTPEFYDQTAMIHQVAKELPVGVYLVVKEHVPSIGYRDLGFYKIVETMPNVIVADPEDFAIPLIKSSRAVVSLLGRSAFEAAAFGVPVLAYSPNTFFGYLDHVHVCSDMAEVHTELRSLLAYTAADREAFAREGEFLLAAMHALTVDPAEYDTPDALGIALFEQLSKTLGAKTLQTDPAT